jgi:hypothetical protein
MKGTPERWMEAKRIYKQLPAACTQNKGEQTEED